MTGNRHHPFENTVGVSATCLRERLLALLAISSSDPLPSLCSASLSSSSSAAAADLRRSSLLLNLFGKYGRREEHELRRSTSTLPGCLAKNISRLFSSATAAAGTELGVSTNNASPWRSKPLPTRRASMGTYPGRASCAALPWHPSPLGRATAKHHRSRVAGLALCFGPLVSGDDGKPCSKAVPGSGDTVLRRNPRVSK